MKQLARFASIPTLLGLLAGVPAPAPVFAQAYAPQAIYQRQPGFSQAELDQMLAPIALYPDALLSQLLIATTYWPEVAEAARFSLEHPELSGDDALRAVQGWSWHPSVKSLLAFPQLLAMMGQRPDWVASLGDAFLVQQARVIDSIQMLRQRAQAAGSLQSNAMISVVQQGPAVLLLSPDPQVIYVPYYDANLAYGRWWWPRHPPVVWTAWSGSFGARTYAPSAFPHVVGIPTRLFFGAFDWHRREARMAHAERTFGFAHAPQASPPSTGRGTGAAGGSLPLPGSNVTPAIAAPASARPAALVANGLVEDGRRHQPFARSGQTQATLPSAQVTAAAVTAPRDQFAQQRPRHPEFAATVPPQAATPPLRPAVSGQANATHLSRQAPVVGAYEAERQAGTQRHQPHAETERAQRAAHSFPTERPAEIHRFESTRRSPSVERAAIQTASVQQQRPQIVAPVIAAAVRPAAAPPPASPGRPPGNAGNPQHRPGGPH